MTETRKPLLRSAAELVGIVAVALGLALAIQAFVVKPYEIPSASMEPTLQIGQRVLVDRIGSHFSSPSVGDVVVFHPPSSEACVNSHQGEDPAGTASASACDSVQRTHSSQTYIKRVVGMPGDHLSIRDGHVYRNRHRESDSYTQPCLGAAECNFPATIIVPPGDYYMMGDNRPDSLDSRFWGPVPKAWIIGQAFMTYWPPSRVGFL
ncbi:MAG: signal peptidase I [Actinomycetota bacterium]|nr:signal peptidase I [Actinomycetota bacterium]